MNDEPKQTEAEELFESWDNGNRGHVVEEVMEMPKRKAIQVTVQLTALMSEEERGVFQRLVDAYRLPGMKR